MYKKIIKNVKRDELYYSPLVYIPKIADDKEAQEDYNDQFLSGAEKQEEKNGGGFS
mgnify:CR=1 FL=1